MQHVFLGFCLPDGSFYFDLDASITLHFRMRFVELALALRGQLTWLEFEVGRDKKVADA